MKYLIPLTLILLLFSCEDNVTEVEESDLLFISSEGNFGAGDGSIEVFKGLEKIQTVENVGDVIQSILVHGDDLFVAVNNSHTIKKFDITESGLALPGIEISTNNSGPREMCVVDNKLYFTNWNTKDIKMLDLYNYNLDTFVLLENVPEDIVTDGNFLFVSAPHQELYDNQGSKVMKVDLSDGSVVETYEVGLGPEQMYLDGNLLYVSRTSYDANWSASYGSSKINTTTGNVEIVTYGAGTACRADIFKMNNTMYRATSIGAVPLQEDLSLNQAAKVGNHLNVYSANYLDDKLYLGSSDYVAPDTVFLYNDLDEYIGFLEVNVLPGDFKRYNN